MAFEDMDDLLSIQPNVPKIDFSEYTYIIAGLAKIGKTELIYELTKLKFDNDLSKLLLIACEKGYKALKGIYAKDVDTDWLKFVSIVDQLVDNRENLPFKLIAIDTIDRLVDFCGKRVVFDYNKSLKDKEGKVTDYNDIPFGKGHEKIKTKIEEQLNRIIDAGYGLVIITHFQEKKIKQSDGVEYDQVLPSLPGKTGAAVRNMADFIVFITNRRTKGKGGETVREMHWRDDGYINAGGRFKEVPDTTEYGASIFMETVENAIKASFGDENIDLKKLQKAQSEQRERSAKEFAEKEKKPTPESLKDEIQDLVDDMDKPQKKALAKEFRANFDDEADFKEFEDVETLEQALQIAKDLISKSKDEK